MPTLRDIRHTLVGRPVAIAYAVIGGLYLVRHVRFQPLQLPAYLLIVAYDLVEIAVPVLTPYHPIGFPVFLYLLAVAAAAIARRLGGSASPASIAGAVALVVAVLSFGFGAVVGGPLVSGTDDPTPLAITVTTGAVLAAAGLWLLRRPAVGSG